jgi:cyclopropane-fatty-acyl-phospholipid synthase
MTPTARWTRWESFACARRLTKRERAMSLLDDILGTFVKTGTLAVIAADGKERVFGATKNVDVPDVVVRITDRWLPAKLAINPSLHLGEAYMSGSLILERGDIWDLLELVGRNLRRHGSQRWEWVANALRHFGQLVTQYNSVKHARRNVAHHYDLSDALFASFLDEDRQYSCGYFPTPSMTIDDAQIAKKRHLAAKLLLSPNQRVLDIGCGWGGLALDLASNHNVYVDGITLSEEQLVFARRRAKLENMTGNVRFALADYRSIEGQYDRIVSVGMFEHVGTPYYRQFFDKLRRLLTPNGIAVIHSIGRIDGPAITDAWVRKYIFPGGYIPALSEVLPAVERAGMVVTDIEILRLHYAETLRRWRQRFRNNWTNIQTLYDERFCRMWEFYLAASEMSFRYGNLMVFQIQLSRDIDAVPLTRDYMYEFERQSSPHRIAAQ